MSYLLPMQEQFRVPRSVQDIFDYVVDFSRIQEWDKTIVESQKISDGPLNVGTTFDLVYKMGLRRVPIQYRISEFDYPNRAVLIGESDNFTATDTVTIEPLDDAGITGSIVTWDAKIEFRGTAAKLIPIIKGRVEKAGRQTIKDLEQALHDDFAHPKTSSLKNLADKLVIPGLAGFTKFGYRRAKRDWNPVTRSVKGKHMMITGATSGLGLATAEELAARGAELTLVARNESKVKDVAEQLKTRTGNSNIKIEIADLGLMKDVQALSKRLLKNKQPIDVLINNAGALFNEHQTTSEGLEQSFALLLLSPYLLTEALHPLLAAAENARVVNVSSGGMYGKRLNVKHLQARSEGYQGTAAYAMCKRGLVIMSERWAEQWAKDDITVHCMHPGWAATPGVESALPKFNDVMKHTLRNSAEGADTIIWLACASEAQKSTGLFWLDRVPHTTHLVNSTKENSNQRDELEKTLAAFKDSKWS